MTTQEMYNSIATMIAANAEPEDVCHRALELLKELEAGGAKPSGGPIEVHGAVKGMVRVVSELNKRLA